MKRIFVFLICLYGINAFGDEKSMRFVAKGAVGSQVSWIKDSSVNVNYSNIGSELHAYSGSLSSYGAIGLELNTSEKLFTRILLEVSGTSKVKFQDAKFSYTGYGIAVEEGYRLSNRIYVFGGPGIHYAQLKYDGSTQKGIAVNVNAGLGFVMTHYANVEIFARGSFPLSDDFKSIGANKNLTMPVRLDYFAAINIRF